MAKSTVFIYVGLYTLVTGTGYIYDETWFHFIDVGKYFRKGRVNDGQIHNTRCEL
jgi:hypothetical protein